MKNKITIRYQQIGDAKRFYEILNSPDFIYFPAQPKTIQEEREFLRKNRAARQQNEQFNYSILLKNRVVGAVGLRIEKNRPHCGEVGYFVDQAYWGQGFATLALQAMEKIAFEQHGIIRIEINMVKQNKPSEKVALKCGYRKEGIARKKLPLNGEFLDCYVYSKTKAVSL